MTDQRWLYWFFDPQWWISATQGAVGALIGFIGLFLVYKGTQRWEKNRQSRERTISGASTLLKAALALRDNGQEDIRRRIEVFVDELMLFSLVELHDRKDAAKWAQFYGLNCLGRTDREDQLPIFMPLAGCVAGELIVWVGKGLPKEYLNQDLARKSFQKVCTERGVPEIKLYL